MTLMTPRQMVMEISMFMTKHGVSSYLEKSEQLITEQLALRAPQWLPFHDAPESAGAEPILVRGKKRQVAIAWWSGYWSQWVTDENGARPISMPFEPVWYMEVPAAPKHDEVAL